VQIRRKFLFERPVEQGPIQHEPIRFACYDLAGGCVSPDDPPFCFCLVQDGVPDALVEELGYIVIIECSVESWTAQELEEAVTCMCTRAGLAEFLEGFNEETTKRHNRKAWNAMVNLSWIGRLLLGPCVCSKKRVDGTEETLFHPSLEHPDCSLPIGFFIPIKPLG